MYQLPRVNPLYWQLPVPALRTSVLVIMALLNTRPMAGANQKITRTLRTKIASEIFPPTVFELAL